MVSPYGNVASSTRLTALPDDLFSWADTAPRSRTVDPQTSHAAAERVGEFSHVHFGLILSALRSRPGTIYELVSAPA